MNFPLREPPPDPPDMERPGAELLEFASATLAYAPLQSPEAAILFTSLGDPNRQVGWPFRFPGAC